ncbi:putative ferric-chelate reductase [Tripterygium wilfordii]|uniref:Putative ferric-chelate reductase n=1 Tax=Tripterygium wilfordii TaxID=458696 RepID=A0A7J7DBJ5_TRIWF|nr:ferric reduction oxidase 8, mitochondrial isoform X2 [Tripterygium wilfordii]KAF5743732.1 putative ferric-chelate reductase [Tripterygium wilfordii]
MAKKTLLCILELSMILIGSGWISLWLLKPTDLWTRKWKGAEDRAKSTVFGYYGLDFAVYTFPVISLAVIGLIYLYLKPIEPRRRQAVRPTTTFASPLVVKTFIGVISIIEVLAASLFVIFLAWTFYARVSKDLKKLMPIKTLKMSIWQLKCLRVATRFGLLAEACLALLLLPILRGLALFRLVGVQFEASVRYHIWLGTTMIFFATIHGVGTLFVWGVSNYIQDEIWKWQKTGRIYLAGEIALVTGLVIWITSLPPVRRKRFEIFYYTHHLYVIFLVFFLFHAGDRHFYMVFSGIFLFALDKLFRIIQSRPRSYILSARVFPSRAIELTLPKDPRLKYTPTSVVYMKIPSISKFQWHSFSLTSSSSMHDHTMSLTIKCDGGWTNDLYNMITAELDSDADGMRCMPVAIEGPYGPASMDLLRYESLILVAGGIGITPFLSILQEIDSLQNSIRYKVPTTIQLIYVVKRSHEICLLNSISSLLVNQPSKKWHLKLKVFVTQEERPVATIRELLNDLSLIRTVNFSSTDSSYPVHGLESPLWMAAMAGLASLVFLIFMVCFNHVFVHSDEKSAFSMKVAVPSKKKADKEKTPSWVADLLIILSFILAITCSSLVAIMIRWRRLKKEIVPVSQKQGKPLDLSSMDTRGVVEEDEIHFGRRPNFPDILSEFANECGEDNVGVLVCGPETMKESVASVCRLKAKGFITGAKKKKPYFSFHSLNFTL